MRFLFVAAALALAAPCLAEPEKMVIHEWGTFTSLQDEDGEAVGGINPDEAEAMLNTWELSYFKNAGTRLFFIVPRAWTDHYLPLKISVPAEVTRVMVGRIDWVTPQHRAMLRRIAEYPVLTIHSPELWDIYNQLGRFRNALVLDELRRRPTSSLQAFIDKYGLGGF